MSLNLDNSGKDTTPIWAEWASTSYVIHDTSESAFASVNDPQERLLLCNESTQVLIWPHQLAEITLALSENKAQSSNIMIWDLVKVFSNSNSLDPKKVITSNVQIKYNNWESIEIDPWHKNLSWPWIEGQCSFHDILSQGSLDIWNWINSYYDGDDILELEDGDEKIIQRVWWQTGTWHTRAAKDLWNATQKILLTNASSCVVNGEVMSFWDVIETYYNHDGMLNITVANVPVWLDTIIIFDWQQTSLREMFEVKRNAPTVIEKNRKVGVFWIIPDILKRIRK